MTYATSLIIEIEDHPDAGRNGVVGSVNLDGVLLDLSPGHRMNVSNLDLNRATNHFFYAPSGTYRVKEGPIDNIVIAPNNEEHYQRNYVLEKVGEE